MTEAPVQESVAAKSDAWSDLALTLPIFVIYHLGVVFLPVRNAADLVTRELVTLASNHLAAYAGLTLAIGVTFVGVLALFGRHQELRWQRFLLVASEGVLYAFAVRLLASYVVGKLRLQGGMVTDVPLPPSLGDRIAGGVLSLGAGFYEEIAFRVLLFGLGAYLLRIFAEPIPVMTARLLTIGWAIVAAAAFSGWHYVGSLGDPFELRSFVFRWVCGLIFTAIYAFRGFAPVVWTHAIYDVWVLSF
jgi:hypothetical protein